MVNNFRRIRTEYLRDFVQQLLIEYDDMSVQELADKIGISRKSIYNILSVKRKYSHVRTMKRIAEFMNCYLFFLEEKPVLIPKNREDVPDGILTGEQVMAYLESLPRDDGRRSMLMSLMRIFVEERETKAGKGEVAKK